MDKIRWGILAPGRIANKMADALKSLPDAELAAVGSRRIDSAREFAEKHGFARAHGSYEDLAADPGVDVVYVANPHPFHRDASILCMEAKKAVLCEKPFAVNARQASEMIKAARENSVLLMEAMWTRFLPAIQKLRQLVADHAVGTTRMLQADFGFRAERDPEGRLFALHLAGGGLLDVGVYPISLDSFLFGTPSRIASLADIGPTGVDEQSAVILGHDNGPLSVLVSAVRTTTLHEAVVIGTEGKIRVPSFWTASRLTVVRGSDEETIEMPLEGNGFEYQAREAMRLVREGLTECPDMPLDESLSIMKTMDRVRDQWGLQYPFEQGAGQSAKA